MKKKFEILNCGYDHEQYFPGIGTTFSEFENVVVGAGKDAKSAYEEAVEQVYQHLEDDADKLRLPKRPRGITKKDKAPSSDGWWWYVAIRY